jgi:hypothetical protein
LRESEEFFRLISENVTDLIAVITSRFAAASLPVTSPIRRGRSGSRRFRSAAKRPSAASFAFSRSSATRCAPTPKRSIESARRR